MSPSSQVRSSLTWVHPQPVTHDAASLAPLMLGSGSEPDEKVCEIPGRLSPLIVIPLPPSMEAQPWGICDISRTNDLTSVSIVVVRVADEKDSVLSFPRPHVLQHCSQDKVRRT